MLGVRAISKLPCLFSLFYKNCSIIEFFIHLFFNQIFALLVVILSNDWYLFILVALKFFLYFDVLLDILIVFLHGFFVFSVELRAICVFSNLPNMREDIEIWLIDLPITSKNANEVAIWSDLSPTCHFFLSCKHLEKPGFR